jgi:hypothetical protein
MDLAGRAQGFFCESCNKHGRGDDFEHEHGSCGMLRRTFPQTETWMCPAPTTIDRIIQEVMAATQNSELALPELQFVLQSLKALHALDTSGLSRAAPQHSEVERMYELRLQFASSAGGTSCVSSLEAGLAAHIIQERMSERGATKLLKLLSDHEVIKTGLLKRMDAEREWIGMIPEFSVVNMNTGVDAAAVQADKDKYGILTFRFRSPIAATYAILTSDAFDLRHDLSSITGGKSQRARFVEAD